MATVKRAKNGEITHIRVGAKFYTKEDAEKINFGELTLTKFIKEKKYTKEDLSNLLYSVLNNECSVEELRIEIFKYNNEIGEGIK